jgi:hypothetical protein|tara:strand:- start:334 stop:552 length:219 start_codon:yes stop_codon:yes gene_type:complete
MKQKRVYSFIESATNIVVGLTINIIAQKIIFPLFDIHISTINNLKVALCFTAISLVRSYCIRRWFTRKGNHP